MNPFLCAHLTNPSCHAGWTAANTPDEERLKKLSEEMAEEIKSVHNKTYDPIKIIELTLATGGSIDWFYSDAGNVNNNYRAAGLAFELRDTGQSGFLLPPSEVSEGVCFTLL